MLLQCGRTPSARGLLCHRGSGSGTPASSPRRNCSSVHHHSDSSWFRLVRHRKARPVSHHYWVIDGKLETFSSPFRYVWPSELDLMARLAGMRLRERWSNWSREPFMTGSWQHISVWEKNT